MNSILDNLGILWKEVEQTGTVVFHSMEDAINHLGILGVPNFSSLEQFIQFLLDRGENPFTFLPQVVSTINSRGGNTAEVLENLAWGFIMQGPVPFTYAQLSKKISPVIDGLNTLTITSHTVAQVHYDTITQVQQKLTTLQQGGYGSVGMQGDFTLAMNTKFTTINANVTQLASPLGTSSNPATSAAWSEFGDSVARANHELAIALEHISPLAMAGFILLDLAVIVVFCVVDVGAGLVTLGIADIPLVPLEATAMSALVLAELQILGLWVPLVRWLFEMLAAVGVLVREESQTQVQNTTTTPSPTPTPMPPPKPNWWPWPDPLPPDLPGRPDRNDCLLKISQVKARFPDVRADLIHYLICLQPPMTTQQVIEIFTYWTTHGMTQQDINNFFDRMIHLRIRGSQLNRTQITRFIVIHQQDIPGIWSQYKAVNTVPNVDQILRDLANGNPGDYKGSRFQLDWLADPTHTRQVQVVEPPAPSPPARPGEKGPDFILNNGTIVDLKAGLRGGSSTKLGGEIGRQIVRYRQLYPGQPIEYIFNSRAGGVPPVVSNMLHATNPANISDGIARNYMSENLGIPVSLVTPAQVLQGKQEIYNAINSPGPVTETSWP